MSSLFTRSKQGQIGGSTLIIDPYRSGAKDNNITGVSPRDGERWPNQSPHSHQPSNQQIDCCHKIRKGPTSIVGPFCLLSFTGCLIHRQIGFEQRTEEIVMGWGDEASPHGSCCAGCRGRQRPRPGRGPPAPSPFSSSSSSTLDSPY